MDAGSGETPLMLSEVAGLLGIASPWYVLELVETGHLASYGAPDGTYRVLPSAVADYQGRMAAIALAKKQKWIEAERLWAEEETRLHAEARRARDEAARKRRVETRAKEEIRRAVAALLAAPMNRERAEYIVGTLAPRYGPEWPRGSELDALEFLQDAFALDLRTPIRRRWGRGA